MMQKYYFSHAKNALVPPCPGIVSILKYVIMIATYGGAGTVVYAVMTMEANPAKSGTRVESSRVFMKMLGNS